MKWIILIQFTTDVIWWLYLLMLDLATHEYYHHVVLNSLIKYLGVFHYQMIHHLILSHSINVLMLFNDWSWWITLCSDCSTHYEMSYMGVWQETIFQDLCLSWSTTVLRWKSYHLCHSLDRKWTLASTEAVILIQMMSSLLFLPAITLGYKSIVSTSVSCFGSLLLETVLSQTLVCQVPIYTGLSTGGCWLRALKSTSFGQGDKTPNDWMQGSYTNIMIQVNTNTLPGPQGSQMVWQKWFHQAQRKAHLYLHLCTCE